MLSRLYTTLLLIAVAWSSWAVFGIDGIGICTLVFTFALFITRSWSLMTFLLLVMGVTILVALLLPAVSAARPAASRAQCMNNLRQISLALVNYESVHKRFPPTSIADKNGKPMHSWRVLILPYLEQRDLYEQYRFDEPWDGPHNKKLLELRPRIFACPSDRNARELGSTTTSYVAVVGSKAAMRRDSSISLDDPALRDRAANTIMLVEHADSGIPWTAPADVDLDNPAIMPHGSATTLLGPHVRSNGYFFLDTLAGNNVVFADGHGEFLPLCNLTAEDLAKLLSIGGYPEDGNLPPFVEEQLQINWFNCIALAVWLLSVALLLHQAFRTRKARRNETAVVTA